MNEVINKKSNTLCFYLYKICRNKQIQGAKSQLNVALQLVWENLAWWVNVPRLVWEIMSSSEVHCDGYAPSSDEDIKIILTHGKF